MIAVWDNVVVDADEDELMAVEARFRALAAEWHLGRREAAALLGVAPGALGLDLVPRTRAAEPERRLRLLVDIGAMLRSALPDPLDAPLWLRVDCDEVADDEGRPCSPLAFLSGPVAHASGMLAAFRGREPARSRPEPAGPLR